MKDEKKTKAQLIKELNKLRRRLSELEPAQEERERIEKFIAFQRDLAITLSGICDLQEALKVVLEDILEATGLDSGGIYLVDEDTGGLDIAYHQGLSKAFVKEVNHYDAESSNVKLVNAGESIYVEYDKLKVPKTEAEQKEGLKTIAIVPLKSEGKIIGCANIASHVHDEIPQRSRDLIEILAGQGGQAIARSRVASALKESEESLKNLFNAVDDFLFVLDAEGGILRTNPPVQQRLGYSQDELQGMNVAEVHPPERREEAAAIIADILAGKASECPIPLMAKDGTLIPVETKVNLGMWEGREVIFGVSRDITERERTEKLLKNSVARYRELFENMSSGVAVYEAVDDGDDFVFIDFNKAGQRIDDIEREDVIGEKVTEAFPGVKEFGLFDVFRRVWRTGEPEHFPIAQYRDERIKGWRDNYVYKLPTGEIVAIYDDVTARKRADEKLDSERKQLLSLFESINEIIYVVDPETYEILFANKFLKDAFGKDPEGGICYREFQGFDEPCDFCTTEIILKEKGKPYTWEYHNPVLDRHYMITDRIIKWPDGRDVRFELAIDITERKMAEERMEKLNHLFLSMGADLIGNMERIVGAGRDILDGEVGNYCRMEKGMLLCALSTATGEILKPIERPEDCVCYEVIRGGGEPLAIKDLDATDYPETDTCVRRKGLKSFLGYPVTLEGRTVGCLSLFDTELREFAPEEKEILGTLARALAIEEERLAREEDMKDFIDIASHELRHPVTLMKGYAISLKEFWEKLDDEKISEMLDAIDHGSERLNRLVLGLLDLSHIERGRFTIERQEMQLAPLIEQAIRELQRGGLRNEYDLSIPGEVKALRVDPERMVELLLILLENAAKFSSPTSRIDVEVDAGEDEVMVSVSDMGIGVPDGYREIIFERFAQVEDALHHSIPGMGMGLYIAKEIVEAHGGRIWTEPREGEGSIFRFTLPS